MPLLVTAGAALQCSFGAAPSNLLVPPANHVNVMLSAANIMDSKPMANILPFGMCNSPANPTVAAATAAALGVLTPMPCIPCTAAPWVAGQPKVIIGNFPALSSDSKLLCNWGGVIQITSPGQTRVQL